MNWQHKDEWRTSGAGFSVVVSRHSVVFPEPRPSFCSDLEGPNRWCVYAYIFPKHPQYAKFEGTAIDQDAAKLDMHGGCTYLRRHFNEDGKETSIQVGADYNHYGDSEYTRMETQEDAHSVFNDAQDLFDKLANMAKQGATT